MILFFRLCLPDVLKVVALREPGFSLHKNHIGHIIKSVCNFGFPVDSAKIPTPLQDTLRLS